MTSSAAGLARGSTTPRPDAIHVTDPVLADLRERLGRVRWPDGEPIRVPTGYADFPAEIVRPPRDLGRPSLRPPALASMSAGGHFAAREEPDALADDIRAFFRTLRPATS